MERDENKHPFNPFPPTALPEAISPLTLSHPQHFQRSFSVFTALKHTVVSVSLGYRA